MYSIEITQCTYSSQCCLCSVNRNIWRNVLQLLIVFGQHYKYSDKGPRTCKMQEMKHFLDNKWRGKVAYELQLRIFILFLIYWCMWKWTPLLISLRNCMPSCFFLDCAIWEVGCVSLFQHHLSLRCVGNVNKEG